MYKVAYVAGFDFENSPAAYNRFLSLYTILDKNFEVTKILTTFPLEKEYDNTTEKWKIRYVKNKSIQNLFISFKLCYYIIKNANRFDTFIVYGGYAFYMLPFILLKPFFSYKVVYDSVEIYLPKGFVKTIFSPSTWNHLLGYNFLIRFFDGAICISSYIQNKHEKQGLKTVVVPPVFLNENAKFEREIKDNTVSDTKFKILFYGFPGKKDSLNNLIKVFLSDESLSNSFEVTIIGLNKEQYKAYCNENGIFEFPEGIILRGKLGLEELYEELMKTDFTFLQRPYTITTKAGFPSKLVESLFFKVPSILNLTSDMEKYEVDRCSIVCKDDSVESLADSLTVIKNMENKELAILKDNCFTIYEKYFSTQANLTKIKKYIEDVNNN